MVCYMPEEKILFSNDAFGQHIASSGRFDDEYPLQIVLEEARKYYANIVLPYSPQVKKALEAASSLDIGMIAPSHGVIWRTHIGDILEAYGGWADNRTEEKAVIVYDTMWNSTRKMAYAVAKAFENRGMAVRMLDLKANHISDIMTEALTAKYICVGSPTLNNNMLPSVAAFLTYLKGLAPKGRTGLAFGSYGWGGQSVAQVEESLAEAGCAVMEKIRLQYVPDENALGEITRKVEAAIA
jgi:flavorubredoxin